MRVMIVSCSYLLYEYLLKLKKIVLGLVLVLVVLSSASASSSGVWPRSTSLKTANKNKKYLAQNTDKSSMSWFLVSCRCSTGLCVECVYALCVQ